MKKNGKPKKKKLQNEDPKGIDWEKAIDETILKIFKTFSGLTTPYA